MDSSISQPVPIAVLREELRSGWKDAAIPTEGKRVLVADVFNSTSLDNRHITTRYYSEAALGLPVTPYSYAGIRPDGIAEHYRAKHTHQLLELSAKRHALYLPNAEHDNRVTIIPVGISGGGVVTIMGVARSISDSGLAASELKTLIPRIILVAPAINPPPRLFTQFLNKLRSVPESVPPSVVQLCNTRSTLWLETQYAMADALTLIHKTGIPIYVVYWPFDLLTPYPWHGDLLPDAALVVGERAVQVTPPNLELPSPDSVSAHEYDKAVASAHTSFCTHDATIAAVRDLLASSSIED